MMAMGNPMLNGPNGSSGNGGMNDGYPPRMAPQPTRDVVAAVDVEFKRGRREMFRIDNPGLAAECATFNGPYHIWV